MEALIARLLNDFENGKMTRRQLIQSLALAAIAAPMASAAGEGTVAPSVPAPLPPAPWKTVWLDHISFQCADYKRSVDFYTNLMGWTVKPGSDTGRQATVDINGIGGIIIRNGRQNAANAGASSDSTAAGRGGRGPRPPVTAVIDHISWGVEPWDTDAVKAELERRGLNPRPDMVGEGFKSFHVKDPDGWDLQISNQTREHHEGT